MVELILDLKRIECFWMCLWVLDFALVLNRNFRKLGWIEWRWLGVFIALNHFLVVGLVCWRWAHRTVRWRTGQSLFTVRCVPRQHARWSLELLDRWRWCTRQSRATPDMSSDLWLICSNFCAAMFITVHMCSRPLMRGSLLRWLTG
jgi:hypothetical protein